MATENIRQEENHKTLKDAVVEAYLESVSATTKLKNTIKYKHGFTLTYQAFGNWFTILFSLTKNEPGMVKDYKDLITKINHWQHKHNGLAIRRFIGSKRKIVKEGIILIEEWHSAIRSAGIIKL